MGKRQALNGWEARRVVAAQIKCLGPQVEDEVVRELRNKRGMTQEALAHAANLALGTVTGVERATNAPDWKTVRAIAKALDASMTKLGEAIDRHGG